MQPTRARYWVVLFSVTLAVITYFDRVCLSQAAPYMRKDLGLTPIQMGVAFSAFAWAYALFEIPGGFLGDWLGWIYLHVGAPERSLEGEERRVQVGLIDFFYNVWLPEYAPVRKTERFKALMRNTGIVAYWKARGWPDLCHPVGAGDFACK